MANTLIDQIESRRYEHPRDVLLGSISQRIGGFEITDEQKDLIREQVSSGEGDRAIEAMTNLAISGISWRFTQEKSGLVGLGVDVNNLADSKYTELAGHPERLREFTVWFDKLARDALGRCRNNRGPVARQVQTKGVGLELGSAVMAGDWAYQDGLWAAIDDLFANPPEGYGFVMPRSEVHQPAYRLNVTEDLSYLRIERVRGIRDLMRGKTDLEPGFIAHRMIGLVALSAMTDEHRQVVEKAFGLPADADVSDNRWKFFAVAANGAAARRQEAAQLVGDLFEEEIATAGQTSHGILPESSTVFIRRTSPASPGKTESDILISV